MEFTFIIKIIFVFISEIYIESDVDNLIGVKILLAYDS